MCGACLAFSQSLSELSCVCQVQRERGVVFRYVLFEIADDICMTFPSVCNSGSEVGRVSLPGSPRLGRLGLPIASSSLNQAAVLLFRVRARAGGMARSGNSEQEAAEPGIDGAGADGLRAQETESMSVAVLAVNFHGNSNF